MKYIQILLLLFILTFLLLSCEKDEMCTDTVQCWKYFPDSQYCDGELVIYPKDTVYLEINECKADEFIENFWNHFAQWEAPQKEEVKKVTNCKCNKS